MTDRSAELKTLGPFIPSVKFEQCEVWTLNLPSAVSVRNCQLSFCLDAYQLINTAVPDILGGDLTMT
jgi:hypothetical protein